MARKMNHEGENKKTMARKPPSPIDAVRRFRWHQIDKDVNRWLRDHGEKTHEGLDPGPGISTPMGT